MPSAKVKTLPTRGRSSTEKKNVIDAAIRCFKQYGPHRTSMTDIAEAAGISRKTLYRMFEDRPTLVEQVLVRIFGDMRKKIAKRVSPIKDTRKAIQQGILVSVDVASKDSLFNAIMQKDSEYQIEQLLVRGNDAVLEYMIEFWGPYIDQGRKEGLIRASLSDERIFELIMSFQSVLLMRDDSNQKVRQEFLSDLLQSVFTS